MKGDRVWRIWRWREWREEESEGSGVGVGLEFRVKSGNMA